VKEVTLTVVALKHLERRNTMTSKLPTTAHRTHTKAEQDTESHPHSITGIAVKKFVLSFLILYSVLAISLFSVFALQDQTPLFVKGTIHENVEPGKEVIFSVTVKNPSLLTKDILLVLEKEIPSTWIASFCTETQCFYEGGELKVPSLSEQGITVNVITDTTGHTGTVSLSLYCNEKLQETTVFTVETKRNALFTAELTGNKRNGNEVSFDVCITNTGNVPDVYTVFVPPGVYARVTEDTIALEPGEHKNITVYIEQRESVNTSLMVKSESGVSESLYLICEHIATYNFELYAAREFYIDEPETEITFDLVNTGDTQDTYSLSATCLSPGWDVACNQEQVTVEPKKSERITVYMVRGQGKNASVIVTATSTSGLSKNIKMSIYVQETQGKTVLAEYFTGTWCYVCSYGERALRQLAEEIENLIVLVYHLKDEIETAGSQKRSEGVYGFTDTVSTLVVNGTKHVYYTSGGEGAIYFKYKKIVEELLTETLKAEIYVSGRTVENVAYITAEIRPYVTGDYHVYFVLFKNNFVYKGETKHYIVRDVAGPQNVFLAGETMVSCEFVLPAGDTEGYGVVVIVQHPHTLEVIQATSYML
jgi:thiol-disulfide isomerase/thioredoxin